MSKCVAGRAVTLGNDSTECSSDRDSECLSYLGCVSQRSSVVRCETLCSLPVLDANFGLAYVAAFNTLHHRDRKTRPERLKPQSCVSTVYSERECLTDIDISETENEGGLTLRALNKKNIIVLTPPSTSNVGLARRHIFFTSLLR